MNKPLNLFYEEPDPDRWIKFDRYPRRFIRRLIRGKQKPGGVMLVALNLMKGLEKLNIPYRFNDYKYIKDHPEDLACIIGKPHLLYERSWTNPILFGAGVFSHPIECPDLLVRYPQLKHILVPGEWMREMFEPYYGDKVSVWPTGIDTNKWQPTGHDRIYDFLIYDKIRWNYNYFVDTLLKPIKQTLLDNEFSFHSIRYGSYTPEELQKKLSISKAVIFLCEHETQGLAYQQILSCDIPILAWDRNGFWEDPYYFPHKVKYRPVTSVPYWDSKCGITFTDIAHFDTTVVEFRKKQESNAFHPRKYILENLTLEICALKYFEVAQSLLS